MRYSLLWFLAASMSFAFIALAYFHETPLQALSSGVLVAAGGMAVSTGASGRLWRRFRFW